MRLLELNRDAGGANPQASVQPHGLPSAALHAVGVSDKPVSDTGLPRIFPLSARTTRIARRNPIDLEHLQQRVSVLERRMRKRATTQGDAVPSKDLAALKQRLQRLEGAVSGELWAARQREHSLLEILSKPTFKKRMQQTAEKFWSRQLPAIGRWLQVAAQNWWADNQPGWWPQFASAWQASLKQARG